MAKLVIEMDTVTKAVSAKLDSIEITNLVGASFYADHKGKFHCEVMSGIEDEAHDLRAMTRICANDGTLVEKPKDDTKVVDDELDEETKNEVKDFFGIIDDE